MKPARGHSHAFADARATLSTFGGSLLSLEARIMFDGAAVATVSTVTTEQIAQSQAEASFSADDAATADTAPAAPTGEPQPTTGDQALFDALAAYDTSVARQEIVFLSPSVREYQQLLDGISPNVEVFVLDPARDGVEQMAEILAGRTGIDAIHIISHGAPAELTLGTARLTFDSMNGVYANELAVIGQSLSEKADLLIYGCNFGLGQDGAEATMRLGQLTGADVAASTDNTGHASLGGDWDLEYAVGCIETSQVFTMAVKQNWSHIMATETILDNFGVAAYNNNNGTQSWSTSWVETDNGGGGAGGGNILVTLVTGGALRIDMGLGTVGNNIYREVDLTSALSATLSYAYNTTLGIGGAIEVQISDDGGANYTTLETYTSLLPASGTGNFDITSYLSANTRLRFEVTGALLLNTIQFDAVQISYTTNDAPVITNLAGDSLSYNEGDGAVVIEQGVIAIVLDADSADFDTGTLIVAFVAGSDSAEDVLAIRDQGTGAGQIGVSGSTVTYGGTTIGTVAGGSGGNNLVVTFNSNATPAAAQTLIRNITYENTATDNPTTGVRTVRFVVTDGDGGSSGNQDTTVTVTTVNDAPVLDASKSPVLNAVAEDAGAPVGSVGTLISSLVDFAAPAGQVDNVTDVDSSPQLGIAITAADTTNGTWWYSTNGGTNWNALGAVSDANARLLASDANTLIYFQPNAGYNGTIPSAITFHAWDQTTGINGGTATLGTTLLDQFSAQSYSNNDGTASWASSWVETDSQGGGASGGRIEINGNALRIKADTINDSIYREANLSSAISATLSFSYDNQLGAGDTIVVQVSNNGGASYSTLSGGTFSNVANSGSGTATFDITSSVAANTRIQFLVTGTGPANRLIVDNVQITYATSTISGGTTGFSTATDAASLTMTAVNDAPVNTVPGAQVVNEDTALALGGLSVTDVDGNLSTVQLGVTQGTVTVSLAGGATISSGANGTATFTLSGTQVQINAALGTLAYQGTLNYSGPDTLTVTSRDTNLVTDVDTVAITVSPVNDAPVNTVPGAQVVNEDTALALGGVSVNDVDGNVSTVQLGVTQGMVTVSLAGGATISSGANRTATFTLSGTQAQINAALGTLAYQGTLNYSGPDTLTITSTDTGSAIDLDTITITANPVNDAPVVTSNGGGATAAVDVAENQTPITTVTSADVDGGVPTYSIIGGPDAALFTLNATTGALTFNNAPDFETPVDAGANNVYDVTVQVTDGSGSTDIQALSITVKDVTEGLPPITPLPPIPPSLVPQSPAPPSAGLPPVGSPPLLPPIVVGTPVNPQPNLGSPVVPVGLGNIPGGTAPPLSEAPVVAAHRGGNTPGPPVPLTLMRELRGYLEERVAPLIHQAGEEVQKAFGGQTLEEAPGRISAAYRNRLNAFEEGLQRAVGTAESQRQLIVHVKMVGGITLTAGLVTWLLRSGSLLASLATNLPAWRHLDPLSVVLVGSRERRKRERDAAAAAQLESKQFRGLGTLLDHEGDRHGQGG